MSIESIATYVLVLIGILMFILMLAFCSWVVAIQAKIIIIAFSLIIFVFIGFGISFIRMEE